MRDGVQQRRLAAAGLAHDGEELPTIEVEVHVLDGQHRSGVGGVGNRQVAHLEQVVPARPPSESPSLEASTRLAWPGAGSAGPACLGLVWLALVPVIPEARWARRTLRRESLRTGRHRGVGDLVEGVVQEGEGRPEQGDTRPGHDRPRGLPASRASLFCAQ